MSEEVAVSAEAPAPAAGRMSRRLSFDEAVLVAMGYKQELFRGFSGIMAFSFCFTAVGVISSISGLFPSAMLAGGPAVLVWSWVGCGTLTMFIALSMSEICSVYPFAGSVYHWSGCMAPKSQAPLFSYICGWFNFLGNAAGDAFFANSFASSVASLVVNNGGDDLVMTTKFGIMTAAVVSWGMLNYLRVDQQGWVNNFTAMFQIGTTILIIVSILVGCSKQDLLATKEQVFYQYYDGTGWDNVGIVVLIGLLTPMYAVTGYEAAGHMSEETRHAHKSSPAGIFYTCVVSVALGFSYILALLYTSAGDLNTFVANGTDVPGIFLACNGQDYGMTLGALLAIMMYFNGISSLTVTTRITFAMARDGAFPASALFRYLTPSTKSPVGAVVLVVVVDLLLLSMNLATPDTGTAFFAITSIATIGYQMSYAVPIFIRITTMRQTFPKDASFSLGRFGVPCGYVSVFWLTFTSCLFFLPSTSPVTVENMNYTSAVFGSVVLIASVYWVVSARHWFQGPRRLEDFDSKDREFHSKDKIADDED